MNGTDRIDLYALLPALYRLRDAEQGYPLRALLGLVTVQAQHVRDNIDALWDDFFIETCADWVVPYIGDLVGNTPLHEGVVRRRADVAKTIYYRRRKGTLPMLEELARDVTGWGAHAVAFFEQLGWAQNLNHLRYDWSRTLLRPGPDSMDRVGTVNLRNLDVVDRLNGAFDRITHTVDVRPIRHDEGWYNIRSIGFFLWRLFSYRLTEVTPQQAAVGFGYHFSPLGHPMPLFTHVERETDEAGLAQEIHVPGPLRPLAVHFDLEDARAAVATGQATRSTYVGVDRSLRFVIVQPDGTEDEITPEEIIAMDLSVWRQPAAMQADATGTLWPVRLGVDVQRGRFVFAAGQEPDPEARVLVSYNYGFSADLGGGPYDRRATLPRREADVWYAVVSQEAPSPLPPGLLWQATIQEALDAWALDAPERAVIEILDNGIYAEALSLDLAGAVELTIRAADGQRPTLRLAGAGAGPGLLTVESAAHTETVLTLNGLLLEGGVRVRNTATENSLGTLRLLHCTLVPGMALDEDGAPRFPDYPSLEVDEPGTEIEVEIDHSIAGWLLLPAENVRLAVRDSILDAMPRQQDASLTPALISGALASPFVPLSSPAPQVLVTMGRQGPYVATLPPEEGPYDAPARVRNGLQAALRAAHPSPAFADAHVLTDQNSNRLIVLPGLPVPVTIEPAPGDPNDPLDDDDPTAAELRLVYAPGAARRTWALRGAPLPPNLTLTDPAPHLEALSGVGPAATVALDPNAPPGTPVAVRDQLQAALRSVDLGDPVLNAPYATARVELVDVPGGRALVVLPGDEAAIIFRPPPNDPTTLAELGLASARPALSASYGGEAFGPPVTLERVTVFGACRVRECTLASEIIFTAPITAERRQAGCVRFSYVAPGSRTPRRYRCQPNLALEARAQELGLASTDDLTPAQRRRVLNRLRPGFTSTHYGQPGYAQIDLFTAAEIRTGAEDGSEMGAFCLLKQPQREANLRIRLEEYLPFGLVPGLIFVT